MDASFFANERVVVKGTTIPTTTTPDRGLGALTVIYCSIKNWGVSLCRAVDNAPNEEGRCRTTFETVRRVGLFSA